MSLVSAYAVPLLVLIILISGIRARLPLFELFVEGAAEGRQICVKIFPYVLGMLVAISLFRSSGALTALAALLAPLCNALHIPGDVIPLALMRPLSGSGALGLTAEIINTQGPDSYAGLLAAVMQGSTDTTLYILAVYFGAVGVSRYRYGLAVGLSADLISFIAAAVVCRIFFG